LFFYPSAEQCGARAAGLPSIALCNAVEVQQNAVSQPTLWQ
jgi:hypothetical protein